MKYLKLTTAMLAAPSVLFAQSIFDLPPLDIQLKVHKGLTIATYTEPNFFERLWANPSAVIVIVAVVVFAAIYFTSNRKDD